MTRLPAWESALNSFLLATQDAKFAWGTVDCCCLAASAIASITGVDIASDVRGKYTDQESAMQTIASVTGGKTVEDAVAWCATKHELVEWKYPLCAQRGDLVLINNGGNFIGGFVHLNGQHLISIGESGLVRLPITAVKRA